MDIRELLPVLQAETEVIEGISTSEIYPAIVVAFPLLFVSLSYAIIGGAITLILFSQLKKKLGNSEKVYEFIRYLGRPQYYRRKP
ncbi:hypothetical protein [Persephonella sp.]